MSFNRYKTTLMHYASPYYDPQKAHEYYMKNRELKGRATTKGLNEEGRSHAEYIKGQINAERDAKLKARSEQYASDSEQAKQARDSTVKERQEAKDREIAAHSKEMSIQIALLESKLASMSPADKKKNSAEIKGEIAKLREKNAAKKDELNKRFGEEKVGIQNEYLLDRKDMADAFRSDNNAIKQEAVNKYLTELMGLQDSGEFREVSKSKASSSSGNAGSSSGSHKTTGTLYKSKRLNQILAEAKAKKTS